MNKKLYKRYIHMKERCYDPNDKRYHRYGGRGITICDEWLNDYYAFEKWAIENGYSDELTIDRVDNDGNYCPENCKWVTIAENNQHRGTSRFFTYNGKTQNLAQWCEEYGLNYHTVLCRLRRGWDFERAITEPLIKGRNREELIGKRFGRLVVLEYAGDEYIGKDNNSRYVCLCDCGNKVIVGANKLKSGHTQSCGCLQRERAAEYQRNKKKTRQKG